MRALVIGASGGIGGAVAAALGSSLLAPATPPHTRAALLMVASDVLANARTAVRELAAAGGG
ncbi:MAG: hypothetical protein ACO3U4_12510, partial [Gemmobacter sp.]